MSRAKQKKHVYESRNRFEVLFFFVKAQTGTSLISLLLLLLVGRLIGFPFREQMMPRTLVCVPMCVCVCVGAT